MIPFIGNDFIGGIFGAGATELEIAELLHSQSLDDIELGVGLLLNNAIHAHTLDALQLTETQISSGISGFWGDYSLGDFNNPVAMHRIMAAIREAQKKHKESIEAAGIIDINILDGLKRQRDDFIQQDIINSIIAESSRFRNLINV